VIAHQPEPSRGHDHVERSQAVGLVAGIEVGVLVQRFAVEQDRRARAVAADVVAADADDPLDERPLLLTGRTPAPAEGT